MVVALVILDGWGYSEEQRGNAIALAKKPNFDDIWKNYPHTLLHAAGEEVGLSWGEMGSSEVGHLNIGSGRVVYQDFPRVDQAIRSGEFSHNSVIQDLVHQTKKNKGALHLAGLVSSGGVHSHIHHLEAILEMLRSQHFKNPIYIHAFTDGRDTSSQSAQLYIQKIENKIVELHLNAKIATVSGRYYAMDRDNRWMRTGKAYKAMVEGRGEKAYSAKEAIENSYKNKVTDEFVTPTVIYEKIDNEDQPIGKIKSKDSIFFFNFRPERMRQLVECFLFEKPELPEKKLIPDLHIISLTEYEKSLPIKAAFPPEEINNSLAQILATNGIKQFHIAETEKYAHVTYFFDGLNGIPYRDEKWVVVPSPTVTTYDKQPAMSASKITSRLISEYEKEKYQFVIINYANGDMVGHTGNLKATIKAIEAIDKELGRLKKWLPKDSTMIITADHGNAEGLIRHNSAEIDTEHSITPVPLLVYGNQYKLKKKQDDKHLKATGILADIAPTILAIFQIEQPPEMTGYNLLQTLL